MRTLVAGSKEFLQIDVKSRQGNIESLEGAQFRVVSKDGTIKLDWQPANAVGQRLFCMVNTEGWAPGRYRAFIRWTQIVTNELPVIGPFEFRVD